MNGEDNIKETPIQRQNTFAMAVNNPLYIERNKNNRYERTYLPQVREQD